MRIYKNVTIPLVRLQISKKGVEGIYYINFCEATTEECVEKVSAVLNELKLPIIAEGNKTSLAFRAALGGNNYSSKSISLRGLEPKEVYDLLNSKFELYEP